MSCDGLDVFTTGCPSRQVLEHVTSRWGVLILHALSERTYRFNELSRRVGGVSEKMLAQTLRTLERDELVQRTSHPQIPPRVEYCLTPRGREASRLLAVLVGWVEKETPSILVSNRAFDQTR